MIFRYVAKVDFPFSFFLFGFSFLIFPFAFLPNDIFASCAASRIHYTLLDLIRINAITHTHALWDTFPWSCLVCFWQHFRFAICELRFAIKAQPWIDWGFMCSPAYLANFKFAECLPHAICRTRWCWLAVQTRIKSCQPNWRLSCESEGSGEREGGDWVAHKFNGSRNKTTANVVSLWFKMFNN